MPKSKKTLSLKTTRRTNALKSKAQKRSLGKNKAVAKKARPPKRKTPYKPLAKFNPKLRSAAEVKMALVAGGGVGSTCPCEIYLNGSAITSANNTVLPGQQINLSLSCGDFTPTNITWKIPGKIFLSWVVAADSSSATINPVTNFTSSTIQFYWANEPSSGGQKNYNVQVTYLGADGITQCDLSATLTIKSPIWTLTVPYFGDVGFYASNTEIGPLPDPDPVSSHQGIYIEQSVDVPSSFPSGMYNNVQLVSPSGAFRKLPKSNCQALAQNGVNNLLDTIYPFPNSQQSTNLGYATDISDSPSIEGNPDYTANKGTFNFTTYLMFQPPQLNGNPSQWVPLSYVNWGYIACATGGSANWILSSNSKKTGPTIPSSISAHPQWSAITNKNYASAICPSPFCT